MTGVIATVKSARPADRIGGRKNLRFFLFSIGHYNYKYYDDDGKQKYNSQFPDLNMGSRREETGRVEKNQFAVMVVAAFVATMAVRAIAWPPGGYWTQDGPSADNVEYVAGSPKMAYLSPKTYLFLVVSSTVAYVGAVTISLLLLIREVSLLVREAFSWSRMDTVVSMVMMWLVFCSMSMVFTITLGAVVPSQYATTSYVLVSLVQVWCCLAWILPPGHFIWSTITR